MFWQVLQIKEVLLMQPRQNIYEHIGTLLRIRQCYHICGDTQPMNRASQSNGSVVLVCQEFPGNMENREELRSTHLWNQKQEYNKVTEPCVEGNILRV